MLNPVKVFFYNRQYDSFL